MRERSQDDERRRQREPNRRTRPAWKLHQDRANGSQVIVRGFDRDRSYAVLILERKERNLGYGVSRRLRVNQVPVSSLFVMMRWMARRRVHGRRHHEVYVVGVRVVDDDEHLCKWPTRHVFHFFGVPLLRLPMIHHLLNLPHDDADG